MRRTLTVHPYGKCQTCSRWGPNNRRQSEFIAETGVCRLLDQDDGTDKEADHRRRSALDGTGTVIGS